MARVELRREPMHKSLKVYTLLGAFLLCSIALGAAAEPLDSEGARLFDKLLDKDTLTPARVEAAQELARMNPPATLMPQLVELLEDAKQNWELRCAVASVLGVIGLEDKAVVPVLNKFLLALRQVAVGDMAERVAGLTYSGSPPNPDSSAQVASIVIRLWEARMILVIQALGTIGPEAEAAIPLLLQLLRDKTYFGEKFIVKRVEGLPLEDAPFQNPSPDWHYRGRELKDVHVAKDQVPRNVRVAAATALGKIGSLKAVDVLRDHVKFGNNPDVQTPPEVQQAARQALAQMAQSYPKEEVRQAAAKALADVDRK
jgi:HEAT repeat protein